MALIYLVRHGQTEWNRQRRVMGRLAIPLSEVGIQQIQRLAASLKSWPIEEVVSSPLVRATESAQIIATALGLPFEQIEGLTEVGVGKWEGRYWDELDSDPIMKEFDRTPSKTRAPGGENLREVQKRAVRAIEESLRKGTSSRILVVSHADTVRAIIAHYIKIGLDRSRQLQIDNASVSLLQINPERFRLLFLNYLPDPERLNQNRITI
jgi:broad specificity phosphatase PhoE